MGNTKSNLKQSFSPPQRAPAENEYLGKRVLLLGNSGSGKSTLFKHACNLHKKIPQDELDAYIQPIQENLVGYVKTLLQQSELLDEKFDPKIRAENQDLKTFLGGDNLVLNSAIGKQIKRLYQDQGIQNTLAQRLTFHLPECAQYFLDRVEQISTEDYHPSFEDVIQCDVRTVGSSTKRVYICGKHLEIIDVGGMRKERKKWIHSFDNIAFVIFIASLSEYDEDMGDENHTNKLGESLMLFEEMYGSKYFKHTPFILILNKRDLFERKLASIPLSKYFPGFPAQCQSLQEGTC
jgi:energy-coupling factor transporter ATP-binding protein EcfA2